MPSDNEEDPFKAYRNDPRIPCQYGVKCYQKNPIHHNKYKHPPHAQKQGNILKKKETSKKRKHVDKSNDDQNSSDETRETKIQKLNIPDCDSHNILSDTSENDSEADNYNQHKNTEGISTTNSAPEHAESGRESSTKLFDTVKLESTDNDKSQLQLSKSTLQTVISQLYLVEMPSDFSQFYEFCKLATKQDPCDAFKSAQLRLVGPFEILNSKQNTVDVNKKEQYLTHWRYYYDPPEFQTIIKGNDKEGLHFGYWRDDPTEKPVFVAQNKANVNCIIEVVADNLFAAVNSYIEDKIKTANPFEKTVIIRLHRQLKQFAKENSIPLETNTNSLRTREKKVVARTFHKAGIVVPYNKKTQLGYRDLAATDTELRKILKKVEEAGSLDERKASLAKLDEVIRLAVIAADECDFGTCLELAHDLFSSGSVHVHNAALQMFSIAYTHLRRPQFLEIARAHIQNRKKPYSTADI